ncbi:MAG: hypothetical protein U7126_21950 [Microcoleus sp.]
MLFSILVRTIGLTHGWSETGFFRENFVTVGKNGWSETGFFRENFVTVGKNGKNPVYAGFDA